jgi:hypothetical protein
MRNNETELANKLENNSAQDDRQAILALLKDVLSPHQIIPRVALRQQENLLYISLDLAQATNQQDQEKIIQILRNSLNQLPLPWLKAVAVHAYLSAQSNPLWQQEIIYTEPSRTASSTTSKTDQTKQTHLYIGHDLSGALIVGDHNKQTLQYTYNVEHGGVLNIATPPEVKQRPLPVSLRPPAFPHLLDRKETIPKITQALGLAQSVEIYGVADIGKTVLMSYLLYDDQITTKFRDGIVFTSGQRKLTDDFIQELYRAFYDSRSPHKPSYVDVQHALQNIQALVVLDDIDIAQQEIHSLLTVAPQSVFVLISQERRYWLDGLAVNVEGLPLEDCWQLLETELERALTSEERLAAQSLWQKLAGHPLQLRQAVAPIKANQQSFIALVEAQTTSEKSEQPWLQKIIEILPRSHRRLLALLAALGGLALTVKQAFGLSHIPDAEEILRELQNWHLVKQKAIANETGYQLCPNLMDICQQTSQPDSWLNIAVEYFTQSTEPYSLSESAELLQYLADWTFQSGQWQACLDLSRLVEGFLSLQGRWGKWQHILEQSLAAAQHLGDSAAEAWSLHQLGTQALGEGHFSLAETLLTRALHLRISLGDEAGAAVTRHNLGLLLPPLISADDLGFFKKLFRFRTALWAIGGTAMLTGAAIMVFPLIFGEKPEAMLDLSATTLEFGEQQLATASQPRTITLENNSEIPVVLDSLVVSGNDQDFSFTENCISKSRLELEETCEVEIIFRPNTLGDRRAKIQISANGKNYVVQLSGSGTQKLVPSISLKPTNLEFQKVVIEQSKTSDVTIINGGNAPLSLKRWEFTGDHITDFADLPSDCEQKTLQPSETCTITIRFTPAKVGDRQALLTIFSNTKEATIPLSGIGGKADAQPKKDDLKTPENNPPPPSNPTPIANSDEVTIEVGKFVEISVLANDKGEELSILNFDKTTEKFGAIISQDQDNDKILTYYLPKSDINPTKETSGNEDQFTYTVIDKNGNTNEGTVIITLKDPTEPIPPVNAIDYEVDLNYPATSIDINILSDNQENGLEIVSIEDLDPNDGGGTLTNNKKTVTYTPPNPEFTGQDLFSYSIKGENGEDSALVIINVTGAKPVANDHSVSTQIGISVVIQIFKDNQRDGLEIVSIDGVDANLESVKINNEDGTITYKPKSEKAIGERTFTYTVQNKYGVKSEPAKVTVTIKPIFIPEFIFDPVIIQPSLNGLI